MNILSSFLTPHVHSQPLITDELSKLGELSNWALEGAIFAGHEIGKLTMVVAYKLQRMLRNFRFRTQAKHSCVTRHVCDHCYAEK